MDKTKLILDALEKLRKQEVANKETWKAKAYSQAIKSIKEADRAIVSIDDVNEIKGIGKSILAKIQEIIETGKLERLENYNADNHIQIIDELLRIHGIGPAKAKDLVEKHDVKNIEDLEKRPDLLNEKQVLGLKYYRDFELRIPRIEMVKHDEFLKTIIHAIDSKFVVEIVGSYRRKAKESGDIDILITHKDDPKEHAMFVKQIVDTLKKTKYIIDDFALGDKKYMGVCRLKRYRHYRRIDMLYTTANEFPFAQLYFTGSKEFNLAIRNVCLSKKLSLSEYGLKYMEGRDKNKFVEGSLFKTEEDVLKYLGYRYITPEERIPTINLNDYKLE